MQFGAIIMKTINLNYDIFKVSCERKFTFAINIKGGIMGVYSYIVGFNILSIVFMVFLLYVFVFKGKKEYDNTEYKNQKKTSYFSVVKDKGTYGEYLIYKYLKRLPGEKRWLFNTYLPAKDGGTTEVDVILIHTSGIYVFESKNYSGWIFGDEKQKMWTQSLSVGDGKTQKNKFLNPIMQNELHIKYLKEQLISFSDVPIYSFIVFSERCQLKNISLYDKEITVIKRNDVLSCINKLALEKNLLSDEKIKDIYEKLEVFTNVSEEVKQRHIDNLKKDVKKIESEENPTECDIKKQLFEEAAQSILKDEFANVFKLEAKEKICPRCGRNMVLRTATRGNRKGQTFWGCSTYPKCKYIENITELNTQG